MTPQRRLWRGVAWLCAGMVASWFAIGMVVYARNWTYRRKAETLLAELRALRMQETSGIEALKLRERYPLVHGEGQESATCDPQNCMFTVAIAPDGAKVPRLAAAHRRYAKLFRLTRIWEPFGLRWGKAGGAVTIQDGRVLGVDLWADTEFAGGGPVTMAIAEVASRGSFVGLEWTRSMALHPAYVIGEPEGCSFCSALWVHYTPQISRADFERFSRFDLGCLTSVRGCRDPHDLIPEVRQQEAADRAALPPAWRASCTFGAIRSEARDSSFAALMQVERVGPVEHIPRNDGSNMTFARQFVDYRLVETLKPMGAEVRGDHVEHRLVHGTAMLDEQNKRLSDEMFAPGKRVILLEWDQGMAKSTPCGVIEASQANLQQVRAGVKDAEPGLKAAF